MNSNELSDKLYDPFLAAALAIPTAEAAVGAHWLPTVILVSAAWLLNIWMAAREAVTAKWLSWCRLAAIVLLLGYYLRGMSACWPGRGAEFVVPAALLILAVYASGKGTGPAIRSANVLRYGMYAVLAILMYSGIRNLKWQDLVPRAQLPETALVLAMLLPLLARHTGEARAAGLAALGAAVSVVTAGTASANLYAYSQGLSLRGITEHVESITACAVTVGNYALLCYLLDCGKNEREAMGKGGGLWLAAAAVVGYLLCAVRLLIREEILCILVIVFWVIVPVGIELKRKFEKHEKTT